MICKHVCYSGRVQGVGFRYTAERLARGFPISGFVRNQRDGSVELLVEGEPEPVEAFLSALGRQMQDYIHEASVQEQSASWLADLEAERLVVVTTEGKTFEGNLMAVAADGIVLTAAQLRDTDQHPLAGDVWIPREKIRLVQRPGVKG